MQDVRATIFAGALTTLLALESSDSDSDSDSDSEDEEVGGLGLVFFDLGSKTSEIELDDKSLDKSGSLVHVL